MANESIFDGADQVIIDPEKDYFSELVGENLKYKDTKAAGRALVEKDLHIQKTEAENAVMREELSRRKSMQELVDQIASRPPETPVTPKVTTPEEAEGRNNSTQPKVEDLVDAAVAKRAKVRAESDNRSKVAEVLRSNYGPGYATVLREKVEQLGLGQKFVDDLAGQSPQAVYRLLEISETPTTTPNLATAVRTNPGTVRGNAKNFAYFEKLRLANPGKFLTSKQQQELFAAAADQGDDFYR